MKKFFNPLILATALVATACTNTEDGVINDDPANKTAISFVGESRNTPVTRAGFGADTKIAMRIKSTDGASTKYTRVTATAAAQESSKDYSNVTLTDARYWDDAYGRAAKLSVYAIAVPGANTTGFENKLATGTGTWFTESPENETVAWSVETTEQTLETMSAEDLTYSNNIQSGGSNGVYKYDFDNETYSTTLSGGCMKFSQKAGASEDAPGKFDRGHLVFNHALTRITVNLKKGEGFGTGDGIFKFADGSNVKILSVPVSGTLDLTDGSWPSTEVTKGDIAKMYLQSTTATGYALMAQLLPDYVISKTATTNVLTFTIDNNQYYVTQAQMYEALESASGMSKKYDDKVVMEQGLNYIFNITVNKTAINNVTATVVPFSDVTADDITPTNARITLSLHEVTGGTESAKIDLYRALDESGEIKDDYVGTNWEGDYKEKADATYDSETKIWSTKWYFESNKAYYHFRLVNEGTTIVGADKNDVDDYFAVSSGAVATTDYHWGAPMKSETGDPVYDASKGFSDYISSAIGPTSQQIAITDIHMMSNIKVILATTTGNDKVDLENSKVYITRFAKDGTILMGTGKIIPSTTITDEVEITANGTEFTYAVVPQSLTRGTAAADYVGITIVTGDGNKYYIDNISTANVKGDTTDKITSWLPGHKYTYTFTLKKTGITNVTCTVVGWKDVEADGTGVSLED